MVRSINSFQVSYMPFYAACLQVAALNLVQVTVKVEQKAAISCTATPILDQSVGHFDL